ncbi:hypothetical protein HRbin37_02116 [bacterium HR37]|jgi:hypothetical protein|nr:hypothetical protein HRbin37_02116 [bacterium HR37]
MARKRNLLVDAFKWKRRAHVIRRRGFFPFLVFQMLFRLLPGKAKRPVVEGLRVRRKYYLAKRMGFWFILGALVFMLARVCRV